MNNDFITQETSVPPHDTHDKFDIARLLDIMSSLPFSERSMIRDLIFYFATRGTPQAPVQHGDPLPEDSILDSRSHRDSSLSHQETDVPPVCSDFHKGQ